MTSIKTQTKCPNCGSDNCYAWDHYSEVSFAPQDKTELHLVDRNPAECDDCFWIDRQELWESIQLAIKEKGNACK